MKSIYTVYQLNEKVNELGNPYIGFTDNLIRRAKKWQYVLKLDYTPNLIALYTDTSAQRAFDWEQDKRVENGWKRERPLRHLRAITKKSAELPRTEKQKQSLKAIKTVEHQSMAGKIAAKITMESGRWEKIRSNGVKKSQSAVNTCCYCNKSIKGPNYFKWHGEKCKFK